MYEVLMLGCFLIIDYKKKRIELGGLNFFADNFKVTDSNISWHASDIDIYPDSEEKFTE